MKTALIFFCVLGYALALGPQYRVNADAPVAASPDASSEDQSVSLSIVTVDAQGRVLREEPITEDELKQIEEQVEKNSKPSKASSEARSPQFHRPSFAPQPQNQRFSQQDSFTGFQQQPFFYRQNYQAPAVRAIPVFIAPQQSFQQQSFQQQPYPQYSQYQRFQPVYVLNTGANQDYQGAYEQPQFTSYPQQPQYLRSFPFDINFATTSTVNGQTVISPNGGKASCKNINGQNICIDFNNFQG